MMCIKNTMDAKCLFKGILQMAWTAKMLQILLIYFWKACIRATVSRVQIPFSPPEKQSPTGKPAGLFRMRGNIFAHTRCSYHILAKDTNLATITEIQRPYNVFSRIHKDTQGTNTFSGVYSLGINLIRFWLFYRFLHRHFIFLKFDISVLLHIAPERVHPILQQ